jgi:hypothetical protein
MGSPANTCQSLRIELIAVIAAWSAALDHIIFAPTRAGLFDSTSQ